MSDTNYENQGVHKNFENVKKDNENEYSKEIVDLDEKKVIIYDPQTDVKLPKNKYGAGRRPIPLTKKRKELIKKMVADGYLDSDIYKTLKVSHKHYYNWMKNNPEFHTELKDIKYKVDLPVVAALRRNALGYMYEEKHYKVKYEIDDQGEEKPVKYLDRISEKHVLPETNAIMNLLTNRHPEIWRIKQNLDITTKGKSLLPPVDFSNLPEDEAKKMFEKMITDQKIEEKEKK